MRRNNDRRSLREQDKSTKEEQPEYRTVLFVENSKGSELAARIREQTRRLAHTLGFNIKLMERNGSL